MSNYVQANLIKYDFNSIFVTESQHIQYNFMKLILLVQKGNNNATDK